MSKSKRLGSNPIRHSIPKVSSCLILGLLVASLASGEDAFVKQPSAKYSVQYTYLYAVPIELVGAEFRNNKITALGATVGFSALVGYTNPIPLHVEFYSTDELLPSQFGYLEADLSLQSLSILFGFEAIRLPSIKIEQESFYGKGIIQQGDAVFERDGIELPPGSTFDLGITTQAVLLSWGNLRNLQGSNATKKIHYGFGIANLKALGVKQDIDIMGNLHGPSFVDQKLQSQGVILQFDASIARQARGLLHTFFDVENEEIITDIGAIMKGGFKFGWMVEKGNLKASLDFGIYGWQLVRIGDTNIGLAQADLATSVTIMISRTWNR